MARNHRTIVDKDSLEKIFQEVCEILEENPKRVKSKSRKRELVICRQITAYVARSITKNPLKAIGEFLGNRDHTTVVCNLHGVQQSMETQEEKFMNKWLRYTSFSLIWNNRKVA